MAIIQVLDHATIDKIAAGEVVERPASIAKELVENAIDAGAKSITVEIKEGGISFLRVTDNGSGISGDQVEVAFLRHATSKINKAEDLDYIETLGFRGEALASIAAVSMVEMITKVADDLTGTRFVIEGGIPVSKEEVGAPDGTTMIIRNVFYNVPARKKFLKKALTEGSYIADLMEHMAMSHPDISFRFIQNGQVKFSTAGNGNLKEVIYRIFGKEFSEHMKEISFSDERIGMEVKGYIGEPTLNRSNRNYELFFINNRYIKSELFSKALEEGYQNYMMQHRFPVCVLHIFFAPGAVDVNVHPTKMEVRISHGEDVYSIFADAIQNTLSNQEMIPRVKLVEEEDKRPEPVQKSLIPEIFELHRMGDVSKDKEHQSIGYQSNKVQASKTVKSVASSFSHSFVNEDDDVYVTDTKDSDHVIADETKVDNKTKSKENDSLIETFIDTAETETNVESLQLEPSKLESEQLSLFEEKIVSQDSRKEYVIVGQIFKTYWLVTFKDELLIIDQHAAHEKVKYERFMKQLLDGNVPSQVISPAIVVSLARTEAEIVEAYADHFVKLGFGIESFGGNEYSLSSVPLELYGNKPEELFLDILEDLKNDRTLQKPETIRNRIATMACKSAVKGNSNLSFAEMEVLLDELMTLDNPYHCPHGRPTIIRMSKNELEKKFKRIV